MSAYFDASVIVSLFVQDAHTSRVNRWLAERRPAVLLSSWSAAEFSSALAFRRRLGGLTAVEREQAEARFDQWLSAGVQWTEATPADFDRARRMLRLDEVILRTPDALHLAIASRTGAELATLDVRLAEACATLGVAVAAI